MISLNVHDVKSLKASAHFGTYGHWVNLEINGSHDMELVMFFGDFDAAKSYAAAINSVIAERVAA